jgi:AcrR family transcriptional regulator
MIMDKIKPLSKKSTKKRGRPNLESQALSRELILEATRKLLKERNPQEFSMRKLASILQIHPMSLYHYYTSQNELLLDYLQKQFSVFLDEHRNPKKIKKKLVLRNKNLFSTLHKLSLAYLHFCFEHTQLIQYFSLQEGIESGIVELENLFINLWKDISISSKNKKYMHDLWIDFIHGFALAGSKNFRKKSFAVELFILYLGMKNWIKKIKEK